MITAEKKQFLLESIQDQLLLGRSLFDIERKLRAVATDHEINIVIEEFKKKTYRDASESEAVITDSSDFVGWYNGPSKADDSHWSLLQNVLRNKKSRPWSEEMIGNLDHSSTAVVEHLASPKSQTSKTVKGLVLGYVQSGKTANFSAVISKSVDAGYKLVVVLAGMHNILRLQTQARLEEELVRPKERACTTLTKVDENGDFQKKQFVTANRALGLGDGFTLVVLKKNSSVLRNFNTWLAEADQETLAKCPTLIIDDESDQASVNTKKPEENPTAINDHIRTLVKRFSIVSYVGYTATPFANVLIDSEVADDLFPKDFIVTLEKPLGYVGTEELFGREPIEPRGALEGFPVIRDISEEDAAAYTSGKQSDDDREVLTESLKESILSFVLGCSARLGRNQWKQHMTMLIHTSHLVDRHRELKASVDLYIQELKDQRFDESDELKTEMLELWESDFEKVSKKFKAVEDFKFETVWKNSKKFLERVFTVMENHASEERLTYSSVEPFWGVVIGGNTLSRGLTLEGLTTSYFVRGSKGYDTLLQMGRWFGYRPDYVDLTRIYVTEDLQSKFFHLATVEQEMRDEIKTMAANKEKPVEVGLKIRTHPSMTVTSNLKMRNAELCSLTYSASKVQALYMNLKDEKILKHNFGTSVRLLEDIEKYGGKKEVNGFEDHSKCLLYTKVSPELILQFIDRFQFSKANIRFTPKLLSSYIEDLLRVGELTNWSVAVMSPKGGKSVEFGSGREVFAVDRSIVKKAKSDIDSVAQHIKVITTPADELIDLRPLIKGDAKTTDELFKGANRSEMTEVQYRQQVRPKEQGLLMLYALNPNEGISDSDYQKIWSEPGLTAPVKAWGQPIAVAFVFPKTQNSKSTYKYVANGTI